MTGVGYPQLFLLGRISLIADLPLIKKSGQKFVVAFGFPDFPGPDVGQNILYFIQVRVSRLEHPLANNRDI